MRSVGLIPARGGSKGIPRKNLVELGGVPLIVFSIVAGERSKLDKVYVTTDDSEIEEFCETLGVSVIKRPKHLATDDALTAPVVHHSLQHLAELGEKYDCFVLLQPTSPFRPPWVLDRSLEILREPDCDSVITVKAVEGGHPARMCRKLESGHLIPYNADQSFLPRVELPPVYLRNGSIYASKTECFKNSGRFLSENTHGLILPNVLSVNLDEPLDLFVANKLLEYDDLKKEIGEFFDEVRHRFLD